MSGPKHLWSGDWESESARRAAEQRAAPAHEPDPDHEPDHEPRPVPVRPGRRRQLAIAVCVGIAAAAVTVGLVTTLGGGNSHQPHKLASAPAAHAQVPTTVTTPTTPQTGGIAPQTCQQNPAACRQTPTTSAAPVVSGPTADWLGMQIITSPAGVVISSLKLGSPADRAGFEPGDEIQSINNSQISSVSQIRDLTAGVKLGSPVTIQVLRASVIVQLASVPMTDRPIIHP